MVVIAKVGWKGKRKTEGSGKQVQARGKERRNRIRHRCYLPAEAVVPSKFERRGYEQTSLATCCKEGLLTKSRQGVLILRSFLILGGFILEYQRQRYIAEGLGAGNWARHHVVLGLGTHEAELLRNLPSTEEKSNEKRQKNANRRSGQTFQLSTPREETEAESLQNLPSKTRSHPHNNPRNADEKPQTDDRPNVPIGSTHHKTVTVVATA
ncbi:hypothetical protein FPQ18DRAFT_303583 [Pyronema domesticum]|nr:hypothetical protein FPQ18DRAFT_303583 [Pyronema domesticum]